MCAAPAPLIDLGLFRTPAFAGGVVAVLLSYAMLYAMFFAMSFALVRGWTWLYTCRLPDEMRETRRLEIESNLWE